MKKFKFFASLLIVGVLFLNGSNAFATKLKIPMDCGSLNIVKGKNLKIDKSLVSIQVVNPSVNLNIDWALYMHYGYQFPNAWRPVSQVFEWNSNVGAIVNLKVSPFVAGRANIDTIKKLFYFDENQQAWLESADFSVLSLDEISFVVKKAGKYVVLTNDVMEIGDASWYKYKNCMCAASPDYPKGTKLNVTDLDTGKSIIVTVNDWGPERDKHPERVIDLDAVAFEALGWKLKHGILRNIKVSPVK